MEYPGPDSLTDPSAPSSARDSQRGDVVGARSLRSRRKEPIRVHPPPGGCHVSGSQPTREGIVSFDKQYVVWALGYLAVGICLGIVMAATHDHGQFPTHAHI